jgi:hypothetical protein
MPRLVAALQVALPHPPECPTLNVVGQSVVAENPPRFSDRPVI